MSRTTLALLSAVAIGGFTMPSYAGSGIGDWAVGGNLAHASEGAPAPAANPSASGGWVGTVVGEAGGGFDARYAAPIYSGGHPVTVTGEAGGSFSRPLAALVAARQG